MINNIVSFLSSLIEKGGYIGVSLSMFIESFFAPIPSELIMPFAGFVASSGKLSIVLVILVGGISSYLGSLPFYFIGYFGNHLFVDKFLRKYGKYFFISNEDVDKGFDFFDRYGKAVVFFGRLIPIIRTVISFPAGVAKMSFLQFSLYSIIGSTLWSSVLATMGYLLGNNWGIVSIYISRYEKGIAISILVLVIIGVIYKVLNRKK